MLVNFLQKVFPVPVGWLRRTIRFGTLRRTTPLSAHWGFDRGEPIDRYYLAEFFAAQRQHIRGRVLEVKDSGYTDHYGSGVTHKDVLDIDPANPQATLVADLAAAHHLPADIFDCFILTQTLQFIYDVQGAVAHAHRLLRPGGVLLATVPMISRIDPKAGVDHDYWRFTAGSCGRLFGDVFGADQVTVYAYGNVLTSIAFLSGVAQEELSRAELATKDEHFATLLAVRAVKR